MPVNRDTSSRDSASISVQRLLMAIGLLGLMVVIGLGYQQGQRQRAQSPLLPVTFAHADHKEQNCAACHHNFTDNTGQGFCYDCHKSDPKIAADTEAMFHGLCRDCHVDLARQGEEHGPVRACQACHVEDMRP